MGNLKRRRAAIIVSALVVAASVQSAPALRNQVAAVHSDRSGIDHENDGVNWPSYGGTYSEAHESPLTEIDAQNVARLGLVGWTDLGNDPNGATVPIEVDGTIFATVGQSVVHAVDAQSGKELWVHDPAVVSRAGPKLRIAWGARGLAYWNQRIYVGTTDGRLIALDAKTGVEKWSANTTQPNDGRFITGAPRAFRGLVLIGHGGGDSAPTRGYVTAYDAMSGVERWRWFTVPGDPAKPFENAAMQRAAKTWTGQWWKFGGGGTVWNAITYDPQLNLVYLGTGNGAPDNQHVRGSEVRDNLYVGSIVALDADSGAYRWHFQANPGETWDYDDTADITLATLRLKGQPRKVLLQAAKNGFFFVIDRATGKLISAQKYAKVTWAEGYNPVTNRPIESANARYEKPQLLWPGPLGAHNWAPMSFNHITGLVYIPTIELPGYYDDSTVDKAHWQYRPGEVNLGWVESTTVPSSEIGSSYLQAWDPIKNKQIWSVPNPGVWPGGTMTTAGNLVFQGHANGMFNGYSAYTGENLWSFNAGLGISGAPITYAVNGRQYVAVVAGWGGVGAATAGPLSPFGWQARTKRNHLFIFAIDGAAEPPIQAPPTDAKPVDDPLIRVDPASAGRGALIYVRTCGVCHGAAAVASGFAPDLRASPIPLNADAFAATVRQGLLKDRGMPQYADLTDSDLEALRDYIRVRARE